MMTMTNPRSRSTESRRALGCGDCEGMMTFADGVAMCYRQTWTSITGGPGRDRTDDLFHAMEARSQLRHRPTRKDEQKTTAGIFCLSKIVSHPLTIVKCRQLARFPSRP